MSGTKREHPPKKTSLHIRSKHRDRYDLSLLKNTYPDLGQYISKNNYGDESIDFFNPKAVKALNKALLLHYYDLKFWEIPEDFLCPPIPGRADYIHHIADLLGSSNSGKIPTGNHIKCLDIGIGANCVYPIIGTKEYGWSFIGSDIDPIAIAAADKIIDSNSSLKGKIECRLQTNTSDTFTGIIQKNERIDLSICNPPFHSSLEESQAGTLRKLRNLKKKRVMTPELNFGGKGGELWTPGGEKKFTLNMIRQSVKYAKSCCWFSTLVSKEANLDYIYDALEKIDVKAYETISMSQGNKTSRIVAWTFLSSAEEKKWAEERWNKE